MFPLYVTVKLSSGSQYDNGLVGVSCSKVLYPPGNVYVIVHGAEFIPTFQVA